MYSSLEYNNNSQYAVFYVEVKACYDDICNLCQYNLALQANFRANISN